MRQMSKVWVLALTAAFLLMAQPSVAAAGIQGRLVWVSGAQVRAGADRGDPLLSQQYGAIRNNPQAAQGTSTLRTTRQGKQLRGRMYEHLSGSCCTATG